MSAVDVLASVLLLTGGLLNLVAAVGMLVLPDVGARLQAATKPQGVGLLLVLVGVSPYLDRWGDAALLGLVALLQLAVAPVLAQSVGRAAYRSGAIRADLLVVDELGPTLSDPGPEDEA